MHKELYMKRAIELAELGTGRVNPNPLVGAVIVEEDKIVAEGYHQKFGELHAERRAIADYKEKYGKMPEGGTIYVTLEPCCHHGKTPPCTEAIIKSGISKVVIGSMDPNPKVAGKGVEILRANNIEVITDVCNKECLALNEVFFHYITTKMPFVVMKYAMTMDGKIATAAGKSKWITGEDARLHVHHLRNNYMGIMVGIGTVMADNPMLNCRIEGIENVRNPVRIICDSHLKLPLDSNIVRTAKEQKTVVITSYGDSNRKMNLIEKGCQVLEVKPDKDGKPDLREAMLKLGNMGIDSILLEGGGILNWSMIEKGLVNKVFTYIAPKIFGGALSKSPIEGSGFYEPDGSLKLKTRNISNIGEDILIESEVINCSQA